VDGESGFSQRLAQHDGMGKARAKGAHVVRPVPKLDCRGVRLRNAGMLERGHNMTGAELAAIRKAAGLSQSELARRAGIGRQAVSYWENKPEVDRRAWAVLRMAKVLNLPLLCGEIRARALRAERLEAEAQASRAAIDAHFAKLRPSGPLR